MPVLRQGREKQQSEYPVADEPLKQGSQHSEIPGWDNKRRSKVEAVHDEEDSSHFLDVPTR